RYPPFPGGRENFVFELVNQLSMENAVLVVTPDKENYDNGNLIIRKYPDSKKLLKKIIKEFNPDIINSHTFYLSNEAIDIAKEMNIPFGITLHGDQFAIGDEKRQSIVAGLVNVSDFVISVSENGRQSIIKNVKNIKKDKLFVINNGVNFESFNEMVRQNNSINRNELGINLQDVVILVPTRIASYKGLNFLVDSIVKNKSFIEKNKILFIISIPDYIFSEEESALFSKIKNRIEDDNISGLIKFIFLKYQDVTKAYSVADIFLLPSEKEQFPLSIIESMACKIPVIATRVGGVPELLENKKDAYIIDFGDSISLMQGIESYLIVENRDRNGKNAYEKVSEKYSIEIIARKYYELYRKVLSK
ncbi:MAG: glycosyltransferase family 4 protein, partial [Parcubacteria group bacterium]